MTVAFFFPLFRGETFSSAAGRQQQIYPWAGATPSEREFPVLHYDQDQSFYPWQVFMTRVLRSGEFPLWNPYSFAGAPFFANGQSGVLYPPRLALAYTVSPTRAHDILLVTHLFLAGVAMFLLLGFAGRLSFPAALAGGVAWMINSFALAWQALEHYVAIGVWLPVGVLFAHAAVRRRSWSAAFGLALVLGLLFFGGNVLFVELAFVTIFGYAAALAIADARRSGRGLGGSAARLATAAALLAGLTLVSILPTLGVAGESARASLSYADLSDFALSWEVLANIFKPPDLASSFDPYHENLFAGTAVGLLALVGLWRRAALARFAAVLGALTILFMLHTPVTFAVNQVLPGFGNFKPLGRAAFLLQFALAVLAAYGLETVLKRLESAPVLRGFVHSSRRITVLSLLLVTVVIGSVAGQEWLWKRSVMLHQPDEPRYLFPPTPLIRYLERRREAQFLPVSSFPGSTAMLYRLRSVGGYESLLPGRIENFWRVLGDGLSPRRLASHPLTGAYYTEFELSKLRPRLLARAGVAYVVTSPKDPRRTWYRLPGRTVIYREPGYYNADNPYDTGRPDERNSELAGVYGRFKPIWEGNPSALEATKRGLAPDGLALRYDGRDGRIFSVVGAFPGAYMVGGCDEVTTPLSALERFVAHDFVADGNVILERAFLRRARVACVHGSTGRIGTASVLDRSLNSLAVRVQARRPGWLVVTESWDDGWRASVDGADAPVLPANYAYRAVRVPAGTHVIRFAYNPTSFRIGTVVSALSLGLLGGLMVLLLVRARRREARV